MSMTFFAIILVIVLIFVALFRKLLVFILILAAIGCGIYYASDSIVGSAKQYLSQIF